MGGSGNLSRTCDLSAWNLSIRLELFSNQFISPKFSDDSWHSMLLCGKNVPWNSEGSRGYMYGEDCCESCPVTHLVHLRHHTFARFYSGSFSWFMLPLRFLTCPQGNIDASHLRKKLDLATRYPNLEIKSKIEKTFWRLGQSTFFWLNKMRWLWPYWSSSIKSSANYSDSCPGLLPSYGLHGSCVKTERKLVRVSNAASSPDFVITVPDNRDT